MWKKIIIFAVRNEEIDSPVCRVIYPSDKTSPMSALSFSMLPTKLFQGDIFIGNRFHKSFPMVEHGNKVKNQEFLIVESKYSLSLQQLICIIYENICCYIEARLPYSMIHLIKNNYEE